MNVAENAYEYELSSLSTAPTIAPTITATITNPLPGSRPTDPTDPA
jgi:hypothetical protein